MRKKITNTIILFIIIITITFLTCTFLDKELKLSLPNDLYDGSATKSIGEGVVQIYDYEESDLVIELEIVNDNDGSLSKILRVPPFVEIPENELSAKFNCQAIESDMTPSTVKNVTVRATAIHYKEAEDTIAINDVPPEPTGEPTAVPTALPKELPGAVWLEPDDLTVTISDSTNFTTEVHCNTGVQKLAAYGINFTYAISSLSVNDEEVANGVEVGPDGYLGPINHSAGELKTTGFDVTGTGPGTDLYILKIHWTAISPGTTVIEIVVEKLVDDAAKNIGTFNGIPYSITIED